jgi:hypothetical protein
MLSSGDLSDDDVLPHLVPSYETLEERERMELFKGDFGETEVVSNAKTPAAEEREPGRAGDGHAGDSWGFPELSVKIHTSLTTAPSQLSGVNTSWKSTGRELILADEL